MNYSEEFIEPYRRLINRWMSEGGENEMQIAGLLCLQIHQPELTTVERDALPDVVLGDCVFNLDTERGEMWIGDRWEPSGLDRLKPYEHYFAQGASR